MTKGIDPYSPPEARTAAFRDFAREFPLERAVNCARRSVSMPEADWLDPELAEAMADVPAELHAAGELAGEVRSVRPQKHMD